ncbi:hypothetical protein ACRAWD_05390 [Caulobacter segnis]
MKTLLLAASAMTFCTPLAALAADLTSGADQTTAGDQVSSVIVTARPNPEDPQVVADARRRLSRRPPAACR